MNKNYIHFASFFYLFKLCTMPSFSLFQMLRHSVEMSCNLLTSEVFIVMNDKSHHSPPVSK